MEKYVRELNRREFLAGMAALGAGAFLNGCASTDGLCRAQ